MLFIPSDKLKPGMKLAMDLTVYNKYNFKTLLIFYKYKLNSERIDNRI